MLFLNYGESERFFLVSCFNLLGSSWKFEIDIRTILNNIPITLNYVSYLKLVLSLFICRFFTIYQWVGVTKLDGRPLYVYTVTIVR